MSDWRGNIEAEIITLTSRAIASYNNADFECVFLLAGQIAGIGKYGAFIDDGWTKVPSLVALERLFKYVKTNPKFGELWVITINTNITNLIVEVGAIKV